MADLTSQTTLTTAWSDIGTALGMQDGSSYALDVVAARMGATVYTAETDDSNQPSATVIGHPIRPLGSRRRDIDSRVFPKRSGHTAWARVDRGTATLVSTETE